MNLCQEAKELSKRLKSIKPKTIEEDDLISNLIVRLDCGRYIVDNEKDLSWEGKLRMAVEDARRFLRGR